MNSFILAYRAFYGLLTLSTILCVILFVIYSRHRPNILIRTCCCAVALLNITVFLGDFMYGSRLHSHSDFCVAQAVIVNYFYISFHAHLGCLMINNCLAAFRSSKHSIGMARDWICLSLCLACPLLPTLLIAALRLLDSKSYISDLAIYPLAFYCQLDDPGGIVTSWWYMLFGAPGILAAIYVLIRVFTSRNLMLEKGRSQFGISDIIRLFISVLIYVSFSIWTFWPSSVFPPKNFKNVDLPLPSEVKSPWDDPTFCKLISSNVFISFEQRIRCVYFSTYSPTFFGIVLFMMYGFSSTARKSYIDLKELLSETFTSKPRNRRQSTMPLMNDGHVGKSAKAPVENAEARVSDSSRRMSAPNLSFGPGGSQVTLK